jgi:hypothetical protein
MIPLRRSGAALALLVTAAACGGSSASGPAPTSPEATVRSFMQAVRANSLVAMGDLWGSNRGPARSYMDRGELEKRLTVIREYLAHDSFTLLEDNEAVLRAGPGERILSVRVARNNCRPVVPFTLVQYRGGWLVKSIDLEAAGNPARGCPARPTRSR